MRKYWVILYCSRKILKNRNTFYLTYLSSFASNLLSDFSRLLRLLIYCRQKQGELLYIDHYASFK